MENEEAFEADAEVDGLEQMRSRSAYRSTQKGHNTIKEVLGGFESERDIHNEESPLLSPDRGNGVREASEQGAGETMGPPKGDGEGDFEGRPWWNKPSVRTPLSLHMNKYRLTDMFRCSGSFLPSSSSP